MASRVELQFLLESILESRNVYFQPPESIKINYPAIVYTLDDIDHIYADNGVYSFFKQYSITVIDKNPDSTIVERIASLPKCRFSRYYVSDNLNHWNFVIYF